ncbi:hypothetical protein JST97_19385 [bacterium]|nr:hypothetical protein [bacterium]
MNRPRGSFFEWFEWLMLVSLPLGVCTLIPFMRYLLVPWLVGFFLPWPVRSYLRSREVAVGRLIVIAYLLCLVPFLLKFRLSPPLDTMLLRFAWFLMAFTAGRWFWIGSEGRRQAAHLQQGRDALAAAQQALRELQREP